MENRGQPIQLIEAQPAISGENPARLRSLLPAVLVFAVAAAE